MLPYILRRVVTSIPVFVGVVTLAFVAQLIPGDPLALLLPENPTPEQYAAVARELGVDQPLVVRWGRSLLAAVTWNFGRSISTRQPIRSELPNYFRATIELAVLAFALAVLVGIPAGILAAVRHDSVTDHVIRVVTLGGVAAPLFWIALMVQLLFYGKLNWLPVGGQLADYVRLTNPLTHVTGIHVLDAVLTRNWVAFKDIAWHLILPTLVLAYHVVAVIVRMTRATVLEILRQDYVRTAHSVGLPARWVLVRHVLTNAAPPMLTILALAFGQLLQGSFLVESVFNWPGMGLYAVRAIINLDYPVIASVAVVVCVIYVTLNLVVDLLYPIFDPRIRYA